MEYSKKNNNFIKKCRHCITYYITKFNHNSVNMLDTLMISSLGDKSLAAVGFANQIFFYILLQFGIVQVLQFL